MADSTNLPVRAARLFDALKRAEWAPVLLVRLSVGYMFMASGWGKLHRLASFAEEFRALGIPAPDLQAPFIATLEFVGGTALMLGLATRLFAPLLAGTMAVALLTVSLKEAKNHDPGNLFYLSEWLLLVILVWLAFAGAGKASVDRFLREKLSPKTSD
jgi:putative oxidoreductase